MRNLKYWGYVIAAWVVCFALMWVVFLVLVEIPGSAGHDLITLTSSDLDLDSLKWLGLIHVTISFSIACGLTGAAVGWMHASRNVSSVFAAPTLPAVYLYFVSYENLTASVVCFGSGLLLGLLSRWQRQEVLRAKDAG